MSENTAAYVQSYMQTLAGEGVVLTQRLVDIFSGVLERQLIEDDQGNITQKTSFETLAQVFTFVASPVDVRPATPLAYTQEQLDAAETAALGAAGQLPGNTIDLTIGDDVVGPDVETEGFITTELNDEINGTVSALGSENTFNVTDVIDGGDGNDVANIDMNSAFAGFGTGSMASVEMVNLTNAGTVARNFAATGVTGVDQYSLTGAVNLSKLDSADTVIAANDRTADLTVAYATDVLKGTADNLALTLNNVGTADDPGTAAPEEVASLVAKSQNFWLENPRIVTPKTPFTPRYPARKIV